MNWTDIRRELHQIPELGFKEYKTQNYLIEIIESFPQEHVSIERWETGLFVKVHGRIGDQLIAYRTDIDGLPIQERTDLPFASNHPGHMHACGHDFHMTIALGALEKLANNPIDHDVLFIFQPAEEGPGGAEPMLASSYLTQRLPDMIFALHIDPQGEVGTVSTREGLLFANTSELFIDLTGQAAHGASPHHGHDTIMATSALNLDLQSIVSRERSPLNPAVLTLGKMDAGFVQNAIADHARIEGTIRTVEPETMTAIKSSIEAKIEGVKRRYHLKETAIDYGANYYRVWNHAEPVQHFRRVVDESSYHFKEAEPTMAGEDFGYFLKDLPGFMFWLGVDSKTGGLHDSLLNPDEAAIPVGIELVEQTIRKWS